jgi:paraquat-inducible protein B
VEVGFVHKVELAPNSVSADLHILIQPRYAPLVRAGSTFWNSSGVRVEGGILKGIEMELESLRSLYTGAIEFATPSEKAARVRSGTVFFLHDKAKEEWLAWSPRIPLSGEPPKPSAEKATTPPEK